MVAGREARSVREMSGTSRTVGARGRRRASLADRSYWFFAIARAVSAASLDSIAFRPFSGAAALSRPLIPRAERALSPATSTAVT